MFPKTILDTMIAHQCSNKQVKAMVQEACHLKQSFMQLKNAHPTFGDLPLTVIAAGKETKGMPKDFQKFHEKWMLLQKDLATRSSKSKLLIAEKSGHMIPFCQPEIIIKAVQEMVKEIKSKSIKE